MRPFLRRNAASVRSRRRAGFTIIELLVAATISLILTYAVVQMFDYVASEARYGRATIELAGQMRNAIRRISTDLACATATMRPANDRSGLGYFEYVEGPATDGLVLDASDNIVPRTIGYTPRTTMTGGSTIGPSDTTVGGDIDDILMFTAYNPDEPFRGRWTTYNTTTSTWNTRVIESKYAEIALWTVRSIDVNGNERITLHRRALLIRPDLLSDAQYTKDAKAAFGDPLPDPRTQILQPFLQENDISVRWEPQRTDPSEPGVPPATPTQGYLVGNTLGDLSRRENRFAHSRTGFPFPIEYASLQDDADDWALFDDTTNLNFLAGNDVLLSEVLAFDVKAFDPTAQIRLDSKGFHLTPSDAGYFSNSTSVINPPASPGAFVDLGYKRKLGYAEAAGSPAPPASWFSGDPLTKSQFTPTSPTTATGPAGTVPVFYRTYCTWSLYYEMNAYDQPPFNGAYSVAEGNEDLVADQAAGQGNALVDEGTNKIDDDGDGIVDEFDEWETSPPYTRPLRGVQVTLRVMEPNSRQVRQSTIEQNFTTE